MKRPLTFLLVVCFSLGNSVRLTAQQIPYISELLARDEEFIRLCSEKRRGGANLAAIEPIRKRVDRLGISIGRFARLPPGASI